MFFKNSRYYKLKDTVKLDSQGRAIGSKVLRLFSELSGEYEHLIDDNDRLDALAYKYYKKPSTWWRICDANADFMNPRALLGKSTDRISIFEVQWDGIQAPWYELRDVLISSLGVDNVLFGNTSAAYPNEQVFESGLLFSMAVSLQSEIEQSIRLQQLTTTLDNEFQIQGHVLSTDIKISQLDEQQWQLNDQANNRIYSIQLRDGMLNVYQCLIRFNWSITVYYNFVNLISDDIKAIIEAVGTPNYEVISVTNIGRVGKHIIVPPVASGTGT